MAKRLPRVIKDRSYYMRVLRAEHGWDQAQAAKFFGLNQSHWSLMEKGRRNASPDVAVKLAQATSAPIELFLGIAVTR